MRLTQLRYFCEVCKQRNVSKAAEALYVTQPAVSMAIRDLEAELGLTLFLRSRNRLTPTVEGLELLEGARRLLQQADALAERMQSLAKDTVQLQVGLPPISSAFFIPILTRINREFETIHGNITVHITEYAEFDSIPLLLDSGEVQFIFSTLDKDVFPHLGRQVLYRSAIMLCVSASHRLAGRKRVALSDFAEEPLVKTYHNQSTVSRAIDEWHARHGCTPNYRHYFSQARTVEALVLSGDAVLLTRPEMQRLDERIVRIPLEDPVEIDVGVLWSRKKPLSGAAAEYLETLKAQFSDFETQS